MNFLISLRAGGSFILALSVLASSARAEQQCASGIVQLPMNVNGNITVCSEVAAQAPALSRQLSEINRSLSTQQDQLRDLNRLLKGLNSVGQNIGPKRQGELALNLSARLAAGQKAGKEQTQRQLSDLANGFDNLRDQLLGLLANRATTDKTNDAVDGPVGDAIAKLDFVAAHDLLEDIRSRLKAIGSEVGEVNQRTKAIQQTVEKMKSDSDLVQEQAKQIQDSMEKDPAMVASVSLVATKSANLNGGKWRLVAIVTQPAALGGFKGWVKGDSFETTLQVVFGAAGRQPWDVNFTERQLLGVADQHRTLLDEIGTEATVCFTALEPWHGKKVRWSQAFTVQQSEQTTQMNRILLRTMSANFVPSRAATLSPASGEPCR